MIANSFQQYMLEAQSLCSVSFNEKRYKQTKLVDLFPCQQQSFLPYSHTCTSALCKWMALVTF